MREAEEFHSRGYAVFGLHPILASGACACGSIECRNAGKHPISSGWQHSRTMPSEKWDAYVRNGAVSSGYGVLIRGLIVVDVDARNGGVESLDRLRHTVPALSDCRTVVHSGSGSGSRHLYYTLPNCAPPLRQTLEDFPGIDFKSSGYVVGPGSRHASGGVYRWADGHGLDHIGQVPTELVNMLSITPSVEHAGDCGEIAPEHIAALLRTIDGVDDYSTWVRVGAAVYRSSGGSSEGLRLWDEWSSRGAKYRAGECQRRWAGLGSRDSGAGYGTLRMLADTTVELSAAEAGFSRTMAGRTAAPRLIRDDPPALPFEIGCDLSRPPGFVGQVCEWVNNNCPTDLSTIVPAAVLTALGSVIGAGRVDKLDRPGNAALIGICVAGSGSGKNSIYSAALQIMHAGGLRTSICRRIKSEQEIYRNIISEGGATYCIDELGIELSKIAESGKTNAYHAGVFGALMTLYSNIGRDLPLGGDDWRDLAKSLRAQQLAIESRMGDDGGEPGDAERLVKIKTALASGGISNPFISMLGFTTPQTFDGFVTAARVKEGFIGRCLIARDNVEVKPVKQNYRPVAMSRDMLYAIGDMGRKNGEPIRTTDEVARMLEMLAEYTYRLAIWHERKTAMHSLVMRIPEIVSRVSFVLAARGGERTAEHVSYAAALALRDFETKSIMARAASGDVNAAVLRVMPTVGTLDEQILIRRLSMRTDEIAHGAIKAALASGAISKTTVDGRAAYRTNGVDN